MRHKLKSQNKSDFIEGRYANYFEIGNNAFEFFLDFGQTYSDEPGFKKHSRIIINPLYVKILLEVLQESMAQHEQSFGRVSTEASEGGDEPLPGGKTNKRPKSIKLVHPR
jgi:hypothetical protein